MKEIEESLIEIGLSPIEASSYIAILTNGPISAGKVARLNHQFRANVYQAIERLKAKGFVSESQGKKSKLYESLSPEHLLEDLSKKKRELEKTLPLLRKMKSTSIRTTSMRIIEGEQGWRNLLNEFIEIGEERIVYGIPKEANQLEDFFKEYHKKRAKKKLMLRHLFNFDARERLKVTNKLPYTESKYLPKESDQPVSTSICGSIIAITVYNKNNITTLVIDNQDIAKAYKNYFEFLWKIAKN